MSSSGAAVGSPGAKADSTGVSGSGSRVCDGSCTGTGAAVGEAHAPRRSIKRRIELNTNRSFLIRTPLKTGKSTIFDITIPLEERAVTPLSNYIQKVIFFLFLF
jgi:hypothetical protein